LIQQIFAKIEAGSIKRILDKVEIGLMKNNNATIIGE